MSESFTILTVCTGNICRSPLAEQLLAAQFASVPQVKVHSAGTMGLVGKSMPAQSQKIAKDLGIERPEEHVARRLTEEILQESDLILAMDRDHKRSIVELNPRVTKRVFTVREFARLAEATSQEDLHDEVDATDPVTRLKQAVTAVGLGRGFLPPLENPLDADVVDPYHQADDVYMQSAQQLIPAVELTVTLLKSVIS